MHVEGRCQHVLIRASARHVFATLVDLQNVFQNLNKTKQKAFHAHITMLDHHPGILARDLTILMLLDQLIDGGLDATARLEIETTLSYTYTSLLLPAYCSER